MDTRGVVRLGMPSTEKPTMGELNRFLTKYCGHWRSIGYKLGLSDGLLNMIHSNHPTQERECFRVALQKWLELDTISMATWSTLELAITNACREEMDLKALPEMPNDDSKPQDSDKSQKQKVDSQGQKSVSTSHLSVHFSTFVMTITIMLEKCLDKLELCKGICPNLTISDSDILLFSDEQLDKINKCTSFQQLFIILRRHWSWKEYSILKTIITICGSGEAEAELDKFEKMMGAYYGMKLISESYSDSELAEFPENYVKLCITIDRPYTSLTLQDFYKLQTFIFEHLKVKNYIALPFIKFLFSSLHLEWYIPIQAISHIIKTARSNRTAIIQKSIVLIKIGDKSILDVQSKSSHTDVQLDRPDEIPFSSFHISKEHSHMICPSCKQLFKNPKYLSCYHSYCEECLEKMQKHSKIICLKCRSKTTVPAGGVKDLSNNYFMDTLINKMILNYQLESKTELRCEECEDDPVVVFCTDCKLFLCHFCKESHKYSKSHRSHNLISLTELRSNKDLKSKFPTCQEHDLELEYYCETCEKLMCVQCTGEHEDHKYDVVKKFSDKYENKLNKITASIEVMNENLSKVRNSIENVRTTIRQQGDKISEEIDLYYDEVFQKLLNQKEKVKQQVRETVFQKEKALTRQLEEVIYTQEDIINVKRIRDSLQGSSICSDQEVLSPKNEVLSAKNELIFLLEKLKEDLDKIGTGLIESANIKVTRVPLPQVVKHFLTIDSLSFEVIDLNNFVQRGKTAVLVDLIAKDSEGNYYPRGGCEVTPRLESSVGEMITPKVADHNHGTYSISCTPQQVGEISLSVFVNGCEIKGSPFKFVVQENKIITSYDDSFGQLQGIACSENGTWAVADSTNDCVHVFDSQNKLIKRLGNKGNKTGEFICPFDVAFDDNNELYVTDSGNHRVQKFDTRGNYLLQFGGKGVNKGKLNFPIGITTHQDKVYVADRGNHRISVFKNDGKFYAIIGQRQLSHFFDIAININSEILAADWRHHCIQIFSLDGHYSNKMTLHEKTGTLLLKDPCSITSDSNGFILIADTNNHYISIFDKIGNCIHCFESTDVQFKLPRITIGLDDNIYVSDHGNKRILIFPAYACIASRLAARG